MGKVTIDLTRISDKQRRFMEAQARYVAYGGARGGGKSWAVRTKGKLLALRWPGIKILIVRRTYPELLNNHIEQLCAELAGLAKYSQVRKTLTFRNGSTIRFGYCATDRDILQYQGAEYDVVFIDEAAQLKKEWLDAIDKEYEKIFDEDQWKRYLKSARGREKRKRDKRMAERESN